MTPRMQIAFRHDWGWDLRFLISRATGAPVHCATLYGDDCYDMAFSGMRKITRAQRLEKGVWEIVDVPAQFTPDAAIALASSRLGWKYDWVGVLVAWWAGRIAGNAAVRRLFCSEEVADELLKIGVPLLYRRSARYTPRSLRDELVERLKWRTNAVAA